MWQISIIILSPGKHETPAKHETIVAAACILPPPLPGLCSPRRQSRQRLLACGKLLNASHPPTFRDRADQILEPLSGECRGLRSRSF
ncbi:MAG TPA: hypothetical protein VGI40_22905 [Pirellulaceae bacterium]